MIANIIIVVVVVAVVVTLILLFSVSRNNFSGEHYSLFCPWSFKILFTLFPMSLFTKHHPRDCSIPQMHCGGCGHILVCWRLQEHKNPNFELFIPGWSWATHLRGTILTHHLLMDKEAVFLIFARFAEAYKRLTVLFFYVPVWAYNNISGHL